MMVKLDLFSQILFGFLSVYPQSASLGIFSQIVFDLKWTRLVHQKLVELCLYVLTFVYETYSFQSYNVNFWKFFNIQFGLRCLFSRVNVGLKNQHSRAFGFWL